MKKSCVIYDSWADQIINLPLDMAGEYSQKILRYAIYGEDVTFDNPALAAMFVSVKKKLDDDREKYQAKVERAKAISSRSRNEIDTKSERYRNEVEGVNVNDNVNVNVKKNKKKNTFADFPERKIDYSMIRSEIGNV